MGANCLAKHLSREAPVAISAAAAVGAAVGPRGALGTAAGAIAKAAWAALRPEAPNAAHGVLIRLLAKE